MINMLISDHISDQLTTSTCPVCMVGKQGALRGAAEHSQPQPEPGEQPEGDHPGAVPGPKRLGITALIGGLFQMHSLWSPHPQRCVGARAALWMALLQCICSSAA